MQGAADVGDFLFKMVLRPTRMDYLDDSHKNNKIKKVNDVEFLKKVFHI